ncbi:dual specificity protein kinase yak1 [Yamadazyma tenuis]|uniref:Kinase-like protein n=1 Tax=Candida tenuis (strain ATCC 10573 / BCRC 21748 / CBS 615 / JCM 9827 / NBRC 10315 / NRRL Y-1498 / VKM Y-70) TaxID=590646 RepID=G3BAU2_CANTC|nr:kinase-like protein [Yamadazyma tenuis ATCC 10573]EGV62112.1 kinase-like protein [Yamadazyma tenuis ATCC 10573]WEJ93360.1 dual specificity protein kinase yak1 [Yamadazyma tenuis]
MSYNYKNQYNRHNSVGGNWNLPPINGSSYNQSSPNQDLKNDPAQNQVPGFRNPWYYSSQSPSLSSPTGTSHGSHSPTKSQPTIPLLQQQQQAKRLSFTNQLPTTYESDASGQLRQHSNGPNFIYPPARADNPFNQHYTDMAVAGPERRMSAAVDNYTGMDQGGAGVMTDWSTPANLNNRPNAYTMNSQMGYLNNNRRSSVAAAGFQHSPATYNDSRYNNYYGGAMRFSRSQSIVQYNQYQQSLQDQKLTFRRKPAPKLKKVHNSLDLKPKVHQQPKYRRASVNSIHISPANALSVYITESYGICQPKKFQYSRATNPKRVLTKPSEPKYNNGHDNDDSDYILYVNDILGTEEGRKYIVLDLLGSGTFGQVVKCQNLSNQTVCAVKVIKSKPAYMNQSLTEVRLLEYLNANSDGKNFIKLYDTFMHKEHLCLVFELLASNLYELIKQNQFQGLNMRLVKLLTKQLLESMAELKNFQMIHCDLKPENILLCQPDKPDIKVIDFGSACFTRETIYSYIQSRFYRSPEVLLGLPYAESIDMWSLGCIVGELFLGLPLFPGTSEYNQVWKIVDMLGPIPRHMIEVGKNSMNFFKKKDNGPDTKPTYEMKTYEEYLDFLKQHEKEEKYKKEEKNKNYFKQRSLKDIIMHYKLPSKKMTNSMVEKECEERLLLVDFLTKVLNMNPLERLSPQEALKHPFVKNVELSNAFNTTGNNQTHNTRFQHGNHFNEA